jgi:Cytochrome c7 and related cytochrome c/Doubled CXXCH motif (Paired_CXXCH_1)
MLSQARYLIALLFVALVSSAAHAAAPLATKDCLNCHNVTPAAAQKAEPVSLYVNAKLFQSSVHAAFGCTACHSDVKAFPHVPKPQKVACLNCHSGPAKDFGQSIHAAQWDVPKLKYPACLNCHGNPHGILAKTDSRSPGYPLNLPRTCGRCHGNPALAKRYGISNVFALYIDSIHGFALTRDGLLVAASCASCHGAHRILSPNDPQSRTYRKNVPATCGSCHAGIEALYFEGVHGKALKAGNASAPVCTDCHTVHRIARVQTAAWQTRTVATCGNCHKERLRSYRDTFHGQVTALGFVATARCWSCHESHRILPPSAPKSSIAPQNLISTCSKCHQGVTRSFVTFEPHPNPHDRALNPTLYYAALAMNLLLLLVFAFFGLHTLLWLVRSWFVRNRNSAASRSGRPQ